MFIKVKNTGELLKVADYTKIAIDKCDDYGNPIKYNLDDVIFLNAERNINSIAPTIDWEQRKFELIKATIQGLSVPNLGSTRLTIDEIATLSINIADAVIAKLKEK